MLQFLQTVSGDVTDTQHDVQLIRNGYWLSGMMDVNTVNCCEHLLTGLGDESCERCSFAWGRSGGVLVSSGGAPYPNSQNAKNTQYSGFVNNLIGISTRVGGTSM